MLGRPSGIILLAQQPFNVGDEIQVLDFEGLVLQINIRTTEMQATDGRIVILAAQMYGARGVGIELDPRLVEISRQVAREAQVDRKVTFIEGDLFRADISPATVVTLFLSPGINRDLEPKLKRELRPGTRIVSHQFRIGDWRPDTIRRADADGTDLFLWKIPRR